MLITFVCSLTFASHTPYHGLTPKSPLSGWKKRTLAVPLPSPFPWIFSKHSFSATSEWVFPSPSTLGAGSTFSHRVPAISALPLSAPSACPFRCLLSWCPTNRSTPTLRGGCSLFLVFALKARAPPGLGIIVDIVTPAFCEPAVLLIYFYFFGFRCRAMVFLVSIPSFISLLEFPEVLPRRS